MWRYNTRPAAAQGSSLPSTIGDVENLDTSISDSETIYQDSFETNPDFVSASSAHSSEPDTSKNCDLRPRMMKTNSMIRNLVQAEVDEKKRSRFHLSTNARFYLFFLLIPTVVSLLFAIAILFPPEARQKAPLFLWTDGTLKRNEEGKLTVCPRESICSEGEIQIILIFISRVTAFASYAVMGITFLSKMHCSINWLSFTQAGTIIPFENLHIVHKKTGTIYFMLTLLHIVGHFVRWFIRKETMKRVNTQIGISGLIGIFSMIIVVISMSSLAKSIATFETRLNAHYLFFLLAGALCLHTGRSRYITLTFVGLWSLDYFYGYFFKTHRLDVVEFTPLPCKAGVQMLWHNPKGFRVKSGEYVKIKLPWLSEGGNEWHAFSTYLHEATEQGLRSVLKIKTERRNSGQVCIGDNALGGREVYPQKTALVLIEIQNEFASHGGKLYDGVKSELYRTDMVKKTVMLAEVARSAGAHVFHVPLIIDKEGSDHPNKNSGVLKDCLDKNLFIRNTWNAEIIDDHKPRDYDIVVEGKNGLDSFSGSNLQDLLQNKGIETVIIGGLLTNCGVESTVRAAYEKGYNVIALTDGAACNGRYQHLAATEGTFKMFSTPMSCQQAAMALLGNLSTNRNDFFLPTTLSIDSQPTVSLEEFTALVLTRENEDDNTLEPTLIMEEARKDMHSQYETTQVFIAPEGDWTKRVTKEITDKSQLRSCWVRGPYTSPYSIACSFNHVVLVASGFGITPALGVMGQYSGSSRSKFLVWSTRCPNMLKFFAPLLKDANIAAVFYTGKEYEFTEEELTALRSYGNIYIEQRRPKDLTKVIESLIVTYENQSYRCMQDIHQGKSLSQKVSKITIDSMNEASLRAWCVLYCGGSQRIKNTIRKYTKEKGVTFDCEMFGW